MTTNLIAFITAHKNEIVTLLKASSADLSFNGEPSDAKRYFDLAHALQEAAPVDLESLLCTAYIVGGADRIEGKGQNANAVARKILTEAGVPFPTP